MFNVPSFSEPLVKTDPKASKPDVPAKPKVEGCNGYEVLGPSSDFGGKMANGNGENR